MSRLPSTFTDAEKREESMRKELQARLAVAGFMQETLAALTEQKRAGQQKNTDDQVDMDDFLANMSKAKVGEPLTNDQVLKMARIFKDELTLANLPRPLLVTMCQYMQLSPYGHDSFLR